jgi:hypothetical protein
MKSSDLLLRLHLDVSLMRYSFVGIDKWPATARLYLPIHTLLLSTAIAALTMETMSET